MCASFEDREGLVIGEIDRNRFAAHAPVALRFRLRRLRSVHFELLRSSKWTEHSNEHEQNFAIGRHKLLFLF